MSEQSGNDDYPYLGEQMSKTNNVLGEHLSHVLKNANKLAASGYEAYGEIEGPDGQKYLIVADNHEIEPAEEEGHYWLHHKLPKPGMKEGAIAVSAVSVLVAGYKIVQCIKKVRSQKK